MTGVSLVWEWMILSRMLICQVLGLLDVLPVGIVVVATIMDLTRVATVVIPIATQLTFNIPTFKKINAT